MDNGTSGDIGADKDIGADGPSGQPEICKLAIGRARQLKSYVDATLPSVPWMPVPVPVVPV